MFQDASDQILDLRGPEAVVMGCPSQRHIVQKLSKAACIKVLLVTGTTISRLKIEGNTIS